MDERLIKFLLGELNDSERLQLLKEIKEDESLKEEYIRLQNIYALTHLVEHKNDEEKGRKSFQQFIKRVQTHYRHKTIANVCKIAAITIVLIVSTVFLTLYFVKNDSYNVTNMLYVPAGQRAQLTLQDGTVVWLNAQSTLTYPAHFSTRSRKVSLKGEAFFDVTKNKHKPFIVETQNFKVKVLGTQFNIYNYPLSNISQVALVEGSIKICSNKMNVVLKPNEEFTLKGDKGVISKIDNPNHFLWKDGIYCFENERLLDIIEKLQLYYDVTIKVDDPDIFNVRYTGKFRQRDGIDEILYIIQKIRHFNIVKDAEHNIITLTK
ncbi:MAG TPA: FecR family protein [Paludibacteraceae bacterium]|nr:FecR family protein [Paludibacteraceae bacterium]HOL00405.1 FecR family protein [Paludibacteraceae bacterium]HPC26122.1 FecR family protein [Paludibacteraceae bacterium]HPO66905.1 FecR family protein [Paludibacteraceae bacterium]